MVNVTADPTIGPDSPPDSRTDGDTWFGHPRQLARLFSTEAMERFGFYGMRAVLVVYLAQHFLFTDQTTSGLYGAFASLTYLTPLIGGLIADRYLGAKRSVRMGAIIMALGYFALCFGGESARPYAEIEGQRYAVSVVEVGDERSQFVQLNNERLRIRGEDTGTVSLVRDDGSVARVVAADGFKASAERSDLFVAIMLLGLSAVAVGNGLFKPNISTIVGSLYAPGDRRRDNGFTIFYMSINLGSLVSQFACPILAQEVGWWAGFLLAAGGMFVAWLLFQFDGGALEGYGDPPSPEGARKQGVILLGAVLLIPVVWLLLKNTIDTAGAAAAAAAAGSGIVGYLLALPVMGKIMFFTFFAAVIGIPIWAARAGNRQEFQMMTVAIILVVFNVVFWTLFEQAATSLTLFADRNTEREIGFLNWTLPAGSVQVFNPIFIVALTPVFLWLWPALARRGAEPSIPVKFAFALAGVGAGFLVLAAAAGTAGADYKVALGWLALLYLIHSAAELCISPVGLSMITKLSIARVVGLMMGVWFLSIAMAQYVGGIVAQVASVETVGGQVTNLKVSLDTYADVFWTIGLASVVIGVVLMVLSPVIKKWMHGVQ